MVNILETAKASLTPSTFKTYNAAIKRLLSITKAVDVEDLILNPKKFNDIIVDNVENTNSRITYYIAILAFMRTSNLKIEQKEIYNTWYTFMMKDRKERNKMEMNNQPTVKQEKTNYSWNNILEIRDKLPKDSIEHIVLGIYTYIPSRRQKDYWKLKIYDKDDGDVNLDHNHIHLNSTKYNGPYMFLNDFKNVGKVGTFMNKEIPEELVSIIRLSLKENPRTFLFVNNKCETYSDIKTFTRFINCILKKIFNNKDMTVNALRHSHSTMVNEIPDITIGERMKYAYKMSHSVKKDLFYVFKGQAPIET
jgi:hypothetical protein